MSLSNPEKAISEQDLHDFYTAILPYLGGGSGQIKTATLAVGDTSVTFTQIPTTGDYIVDFYTSNGINYTAIDTSVTGQVTLTYKAQEVAVTVYCQIKEV